MNKKSIKQFFILVAAGFLAAFSGDLNISREFHEILVLWIGFMSRIIHHRIQVKNG